MQTQPRSQSKRPSWKHLYQIALEQAGHFTTAQAASAGYSPQLLVKYVANGHIVRVRRGIYRLAFYPSEEDEDLVVLWLWSSQQGVFSHETALSRHGLSDVLPAQVHMTVPRAWSRRRLKVPCGLRCYHADLEAADWQWHGCVPMTTPVRTLHDCVAAHVSPAFIHQAIREGLARGLFNQAAVASLQGM